MSDINVTDHDVRGPYAGTRPAQPLVPPHPASRLTPGEEARTLVARATRGALSTLAVEPPGYPFGSVAPYGLLADGTPVLFMSAMAEHTRNLDADPRAALLVTEGDGGGDPLAVGRVTLLGRVEVITEDPDVAQAREAYLAANPDAAGYIDFGDFSFRRLVVERVRWVGGFGRMAWADPGDYATAVPDPTREVAAGAIAHLNDDHPDALLCAAQAFGGHPDATSARAERIDRYGIDLVLATPRGPAAARVGFGEPVPDDDPDGLRQACVDLAHRARAALGVVTR